MAFGLFWATVLLGVFIAVLAADIMGLFSNKNHFDVEGKTVLITGGSQGMGRGLAKLLAKKGANVIIVARNQAKLSEALKDISNVNSEKSQRCHAISADVTKPEENERILREATEWNGGNPPDIVWANAGASHPSLFIDTPIETLRSQMEINYWAATYLAHATLRLWLKAASPVSKQANIATAGAAKPRHFVVTSSSLCFCGVAGYAPYSPAKSALRSLCDTLRSELNLYNGYRKGHPEAGPTADIQIHCVVPGTILSPGHEQEQTTKHPITMELESGDPAQTEDEVAAIAVRGLEKGGYLITTQFLGHAMRAGSMGNSPRNNWLVDTVFGWVVYVAWLFIGPDMEGKVYKYGKMNQVKLPE